MAFKLLPRSFDYFHGIGGRSKLIFIGVFNFVPASSLRTGRGECDAGYDMLCRVNLDFKHKSATRMKSRGNCYSATLTYLKSMFR